MNAKSTALLSLLGVCVVGVGIYVYSIAQTEIAYRRETQPTEANSSSQKNIIIAENTKWHDAMRMRMKGQLNLLEMDKISSNYINALEGAIKNQEKCCYFLLAQAVFIKDMGSHSITSGIIENAWNKKVFNQDVRKIIVILAEGARSNDKNCKIMLEKLSIDPNNVDISSYRQMDSLLENSRKQYGKSIDSEINMEALINQYDGESIIFYQQIGYLDPYETADWKYNPGPRKLKQKLVETFGSWQQWAAPFEWKNQ